MDVSSEAEVAAGIDWVQSKFGRIDILVNNAGINTGKHRVTLDEFPVEEWDRIMAVDLRGLFLVSRAGSALMLRHGGGRIVNIASVLGVVPARLQCAYTAAKAGVVHLTRTMAIELGSRGVLTNCVAPGSVLEANEVSDAEMQLDLVMACGEYANDLGLGDASTRGYSDVQNYLEGGAKVLLDSLGHANEADRSFRQSQMQAAVRFCRIIFGADYAGLLAKAAEMATQKGGEAQRARA